MMLTSVWWWEELMVTTAWSTGPVSTLLEDTRAHARPGTDWTPPTPRVCQWTCVTRTETRVMMMPRVSALVQVYTRVSVTRDSLEMGSTVNVSKKY